MDENKELLVFEKIGDYSKEAKRFIKGAVKSKLFNTEENQVVVTICKGEFNKKTKMGTVSLIIRNTCGMTTTFEVAATTRVYNKIEVALFDKLVTQMSKIKNFGGLVIE
jgi:hypothetical protein